MTTKIYVEQLTNDKTVGITSNVEMMLYNTEQLHFIWKQDINQSPIVFQAGRFIALIMVDTEEKIAMVFMDLKKDKDKALWASRQYENIKTQRLFMKTFYKICETYKEKYNEVEIIVNNNFTPDLSGN